MQIHIVKIDSYNVNFNLFRSRMEDRHCMFISTKAGVSWAVLAVFDGHGGEDASDIASHHLRECFERARKEHSDIKVRLVLLHSLQPYACLTMDACGARNYLKVPLLT